MIDWLAGLDPRTLLVGFTLLGAALAVPFEVAAVRSYRRLRLGRGTLHLFAGGFLIALGLAAALLAASLHTYARLTHEQQAAVVTLRQLAERNFAATLEVPGAAPRHFELRGDEWQIDARVLKWRGLGALAGFDTVYRLERLSGRYADTAAERGAPRSVHALAAEEPLDLWSLLRRYHDYLPLADAYYGSAVYVPMAEGARYAVSVSASGLVVRPANQAAQRALGGWK